MMWMSRGDDDREPLDDPDFEEHTDRQTRLAEEDAVANR